MFIIILPAIKLAGSSAIKKLKLITFFDLIKR